MIGHLQRNKVKYLAPFVSLIHGVDSLRLLKEIDKQAEKNDRVIKCLLQIFIADEETKFGLSPVELKELIGSEEFKNLKHIQVVGLMGMATNTDDREQIRSEFRGLKSLFEELKTQEAENLVMKELSMGMTSDYPIACEEGSTMVRIGSAIFGSRNYQ
jgi:pyridoxal phosphate enzyme (YggS family)